MRYDNPAILDMERKLENIRQCPEYHLCRKKVVFNDLMKKEAVLSFLIEHPQYSDPEARRGETKHIREGITRLDSAWNYVVQQLPKVEIDLTAEKIVKLGQIVNPQARGFRTCNVFLNLPDYTPPNYVKVPYWINDMLVRMKDNDLHPVERAAFLHMRTFAIQPFSYGNKRTARLLQNKVLDEYNLPPAIIPFGERTFYISLLEQAMASYRDGNVAKQLPFYQYIAAKTNVALDNLLRSLKDKDLCESCLGVGKKTKKKTK